jgi:hypothetical protein
MVNHELIVRQLANALIDRVSVGNPLPNGMALGIREALSELNEASRAISASKLDYFAQIEARQILDAKFLDALRNL